jgi:hypothetical protein
MTILKNRYFVGQEVFNSEAKVTAVIHKIEADNIFGVLMYYVQTSCSANWVLEDKLYESKEAYEKSLNEIRVGDEFYYLDTDETDDNLKIYKQKCEAFSQNDAYIFNENNRRRPVCSCFKTKELLLAAVQKAVKECEE